MINKLRPKSEFNKNILTLMTGTTIAQAIPIAISPILTRIYTPEDFGVFALFVAITSILAVIVTGKYELSIMLPNNELNSFNIVVLSIIINIIISLFFLIIIVFFNDIILSLLSLEKLGNWLYLVPFSVFFMGLINTLNYWLNLKKSYKQLSYNKVIRSGVNSSSNLIFGFSKFGYDGFIISQILAQTIIATILIKKTFQNKYIQHINKLKLIALAKRYIKFPKITMFHSLFSTFSNQFPIFMISYFFNANNTGHYSFATKIIAVPIGLISSSFYQVFFQAFTKEKNKLKLYRNKFFKINIVFLPLFIVFWFLLPSIFSFVFGDNWQIAGKYAQILLPLIYLKFLSNLFTTTVYIYYEKQFENLFIGIIIAILNISSLLIGGISQNIELGLFLMMMSNSSIIIFKLYRSYGFVKEDIKC